MDKDILICYYTQAITAYDREARLLFERLNFFLASMAFLILALATLLTSKPLEFRFITYAVILLGLAITLLFLAVNRLAQSVVKRHRDFIYYYEKQIKELFKHSLGDNYKAEEPHFIYGPYDNSFPDNSPKETKGKYLAGYPVVHAIIVPLTFLAFWMVVIVYWFLNSELSNACILIPIHFVAIFILAIAGWVWPQIGQPKIDPGS